MILGGSWQVVANAEKHGGFFWWMDKNEEGTTMITAPEGVEEFNNVLTGRYYGIDEVPKEYRRYVEQVCDTQELSEYSFIYSKIIRSTHKDNIYVFMRGNKDIIRFEIIVYPQEILRVREIYPGYIFEREFEDDGIIFDVLSKKELSRQNTYLMYIVMSNEDESSLQSIVVEYKNLILESNINK